MARTWDSYFWPGTEVFKNKLGITNADQLAEAEYELSELRMQQLLAQPELVATDEPARRIQQVHRHLFQDVYDWAGELRSFDLRKEQSVFAGPASIADSFNHGARQLRSESWSSKRKAVNGIAEAFGWLNYAHPFREGNGRATRTYLRLALRENGLDLDMSSIGKKRWIVASILTAPRDNMLGMVTVSPGAIKPLLNVAVQPAKAIHPVSEATIRRATSGLSAHPDAGRRRSAASRLLVDSSIHRPATSSTEPEL